MTAAFTLLFSFGGNPVTRAATKYTAYAGGGSSGISVETFRPKDIFVHVGDSVEWTNPYAEIHTVTFLGDQEAPAFIIPAGPPPADGPPKLIVNPVVSTPTTDANYDGGFANSGILAQDQTFELTFNDEGTFHFICVIHPGMEGDVHVVADGVTVPDQEHIDYSAQQELDRDLAPGKAASAAVTPSVTKNDDGTSTWGVSVPASVGLTDVNQFVPAKVNVGVGDTVTWTNDTFVPHTVTYTPDGSTPGFIAPEFSDSGPPTLVLDPKILFPSQTGPNFTGDQFVNSGFLGVGPEATAGTDYSLTFTNPGTYLFICTLHIDQGMATVVQVGGAVTPPNTGDAGLASVGNGYSLWLLGTLLVAIAGSSFIGFRRLAETR